MRLANLGCESKCPCDDTNRLLVESSRLNAEAKQLNAWTPKLTDESRHHNVEGSGLITHQKMSEEANLA